MLVLHYVFAVVFILSARVSSSYVSRETAEVGVAICIKPAEARNADYCPWYRVTKYLESLRVVWWRDTATICMYGAKNKSCINGERSNYRRTTSCLDRCNPFSRLVSESMDIIAWRQLRQEHNSLSNYRLSVLFHSISFHFILFHSIPFHSIPFHSIPFHVP